MAFLPNKTTFSHLRPYSQADDSQLVSRRREFHIEAGTREKALLAPDSTLKRFKSHKKNVWHLKRVGDVVTVVVVSYDIHFSRNW